MKHKTKYLILAIVLIVCASVFVGCKSNGHRKGHEFALDYISETLDLTETQQTDLEAIKEEVMAQVDDIHASKKAMCTTLKGQLEQPQMDTMVIQELVENHRKQTNTIVDLVVERLIEFHAQLTPGQKTKLIAKLEKFERWHK